MIKCSGARITGFRLVEDENRELRGLLEDWRILTNKIGGRVVMDVPIKIKVRIINYKRSKLTFYN